MFLTNIGLRFVAAAAIFALPALSQPDMERSRHEVSGQGLGSFVKKTTEEGIEHKATHSGGGLGSYRLYFSSRHGVEGTYSYAQNTQSYGLTSGRIGVKTRSHEASGAYFVRFPMGKFVPFALAGAGALIFDPKDNGIDRQHAPPSSTAVAWISISQITSLYGHSIAVRFTIRRPTIYRRSRTSIG